VPNALMFIDKYTQVKGGRGVRANQYCQFWPVPAKLTSFGSRSQRGWKVSKRFLAKVETLKLDIS
jgi:hypothetical protein